MTKKFIYGRNNTIHSTKFLHIETDWKGQVVSVWFRCLALPFKQVKVNRQRANEMREAYKKDMKIDIIGIEIKEQKN